MHNAEDIHEGRKEETNPNFCIKLVTFGHTTQKSKHKLDRFESETNANLVWLHAFKKKSGLLDTEISTVMFAVLFTAFMDKLVHWASDITDAKAGKFTVPKRNIEEFILCFGERAIKMFLCLQEDDVSRPLPEMVVFRKDIQLQVKNEYCEAFQVSFNAHETSKAILPEELQGTLPQELKMTVISLSELERDAKLKRDAEPKPKKSRRAV